MAIQSDNRNINSDLQIIFICQPGELEIKSLFLAYSLKCSNEHIRRTVFIPEHLKYELNPLTVELFQELGTEISYFINPFIEKRKKIIHGDWMSNKLYALQSAAKNYNILFLDSDIIIQNKLPELICNCGLRAKPADISSSANWTYLYEINKTPFPKRTTTSTVDYIESAPYFNSGVLWINKTVVNNILKKWEEVFLTLSGNTFCNSGMFDIFHRDQIGLSVAIENLNISFSVFDEKMNFPVRRRKQAPNDAFALHYHDCYTFSKYKALLHLLNEFQNKYPGIKSVMNSSTPWRLLSMDKTHLLSAHEQIVKIIQRFKRRF